MTQLAFVKTAHTFAEEAKSFTHINNDEAYSEALSTIALLMEYADDDPKDILNYIITGIADAVEDYENQFSDIVEFDSQAISESADIATLRLLMSQHNLTGSDFPEIGDKTLISKILKGERNLTKQHIALLSARFKINPSLFFD